MITISYSTSSSRQKHLSVRRLTFCANRATPLPYVDTYRPHTYGVRLGSCGSFATEPCRPTACAKHTTPPPFTSTANSKLLTPNWFYSFSAKEKDSETGLSYFGSRYYSSDLSIWLSVDPMSDKYASLSPYVYCADNPVKLVDPNGEDYEVVVDNDNKTITIRATYYVTNETKIGMETAFQYFTSQQQNLSYTNEDGETYSIKFDLSIAGVFDTKEKAYSAMIYSKDKFANACWSDDVVLDEKGNPVLGKTVFGNKITVRSDCTMRFRTYAHEIGHTLGMGEWSYGLMESGGSAQNLELFNVYIQQTMARTALGARPDNIQSSVVSTEGTHWLHIGKGYIK